ncbi:MAG: hypothetical protein IH944_13755 [Armatimonadetes bacterium]|nr:hypothetical protein [Armatimonadota bacterium]
MPEDKVQADMDLMTILVYWRQREKELQMTARGRFAQMEIDAAVALHVGEKMQELGGTIDKLTSAQIDSASKMEAMTKAYKNATVWIAVFTGGLVFVGIAQIVASLNM